MESVATARVLFADTDAMGIVYYANYLRWFEVGRVELLRRMGMVYRELTARGIHLPVTEVAIRYLSPARYDDLLEIQAEVRDLRRARVSFRYRILRAPDEVLAEGSTTHAFTDESGRVIRVPAELRNRFLPRETTEKEEGARGPKSGARSGPGNGSGGAGGRSTDGSRGQCRGRPGGRHRHAECVQCGEL